jgi:hypothetical protein
MDEKKDTPETAQATADSRRRFLKKAGTIAIAAPVMESISREGLLVRSAHAQTIQFQGLGGPFNGIIGTFV